MAQIKVGITGTHGTGKSWKAKELHDHFVEVNKMVSVVDEVARSCPYKLGTIQAQEYIWHTQMERETHAMKQDVDVIITDRTCMDNLMYYRAIIDDIADPHDWWESFYRWQTLYEEAKAWMATYDQVIRLPLNLEYLKADDPIRPKDPVYAWRIDRSFDRFVDPFVTQYGASND